MGYDDVRILDTANTTMTLSPAWQTLNYIEIHNSGEYYAGRHSKKKTKTIYMLLNPIFLEDSKT